VVRNLLDNAARHARSQVELSLTESSTDVTLTVVDDGPGIPEADRQRVFERFARVDDARGRDGDGGAGLGLAIVHDVVVAHGGSVAVENTPGASFTVAAVGEVPAFSVKLRKPAGVAPDAVVTRKGAPLFVVADTHGEYEILAGMLIQQHIVDARLHWNFERGHLVVLGDVFDRGAHQTEILWLLYQLEGEARKAGGGVDFVLGNHETMALLGDLRYLNPKYLDTAKTLGVQSYPQLFDKNSVLGQWLRTRATVIKVNGLLCLHGGISPELLARKLPLRDINDAVRDVLYEGPPGDDAARERAGFLLGENGPLWYRGYFPSESGGATTSADDVARIRQFYGVERILVGHTRVPTITPLYGGGVIAVQVYPRHVESGRVSFEALLIRQGVLYRARPDGTTERLLPAN
jgi:hypothetical protein